MSVGSGEENSGSRWEDDKRGLLYGRNKHALASYLSVMGVEGIAQSHFFVEAARKLALSWIRHIPEETRLGYDMILLVTDPYNLLNAQARICLREVGWLLIWVEPLYGIPSASSYLLQNHYTHTAQFTKLRLWTLEGYEDVLYLDSDMLIMRDIMTSVISGYKPNATTLVAARDAYGREYYYFNAGLLYLAPSNAVFNEMMRAVPMMSYDTSTQEQAFLNVFWKNKTVFMPTDLSECVGWQSGNKNNRTTGVLHYIGTNKPWFICYYVTIVEKEVCDEWRFYGDG